MPHRGHKLTKGILIFDPEKCVRILSLLKHPVCVAALTVLLDSHAMTNLFSMYEVRIICLWTWHHWLVNSCEATQTLGRGTIFFFFPFPFCFDFSIEKCHWSGNSPWLLSSPAFFHRPSGLNVLPSYVVQAVLFAGFRDRRYITNTNLFCFAFVLWLYFKSTFCVIPDARNHCPQASLKCYKSSPPMFQPCQDDILLLFLPCGGKKLAGRRNG